MSFEYFPQGVCSKRYVFDIEGDTIKGVRIEGGCRGNLAGISKLITGMKVQDVVEKLEGTTCGPRPTSCPDQIALALKQYAREYL